jgi:hypothetical protein
MRKIAISGKPLLQEMPDIAVFIVLRKTSEVPRSRQVV